MGLFTSEDITAIQDQLQQAGLLALRGRSNARVEFKPDHTPYTDIELAMEDQLIPFLQSRFPGDQIVTEEHGVNGVTAERVWLLDPIDGTKVYLNGLPTWGISLGFLFEGQPILGFFYLPKTGELYWGSTIHGAFLNHKRLPERDFPRLDNPLAFLAAPTNAHRYYQIDYPRVRALGSTAAHLCYLAQGAAIGVLTRRVVLWDIAGVLPILAETGMVVSFLSGKPFHPQDFIQGQKMPEELLAAHPDHIEILRGKICKK